jgi:hypothetical protein
MPLSEIIQG